MVNHSPRTPRRRGYSRKLAEEFCALSRRILREANSGVARDEFTRMVLSEFIEFSGCDEVEMRVNEGSRYYRGVLKTGPDGKFKFRLKTKECSQAQEVFLGDESEDPDVTMMFQKLATGDCDPKQPGFTTNGAFLITDCSHPVRFEGREINIRTMYQSLAILPFTIADNSHGLIILKSCQPGFFRELEVEFYQGVAQSLGVAFADRRAQAALRERVKELTCLYELDRVLSREEGELGEIMRAAVKKLPPAWLHSDIAAACIELDGMRYETPGFENAVHRQSAVISVHGIHRGRVEVVYREPRPVLDEGPFLKEERNLIEAVAGEIGRFIERWEAKQEKKKLEQQLRHADRLATIGQLAAGIAHELNEPLASILGFSQLLQKMPDLPEQAVRDLERIVKATLHARGVISKLMFFARPRPPQQMSISVNQLITESMYFVQSRCAKAGVQVVYDLAPDLPMINADPTQLQQVVINLAVNAIQAMPGGGTLTLATRKKDGFIALIVEDTGIGMSEEVKAQIFLPFFTTKPAGEGTGLGLSVVHGIITAHGGRINVESVLGKGSRFEVLLLLNGPRESQEGR
ncbi:MAG: ATP-binding protein [candidate division WOR-3 bacterium]